MVFRAKSVPHGAVLLKPGRAPRSAGELDKGQMAGLGLALQVALPTRSPVTLMLLVPGHTWQLSS